jgi:hypothetical protein
VTVIVISSKNVMSSVTPTASIIPRMPPATHSKDDSIKNCSRICLRVAPSAFLKPTSKVRFGTERAYIHHDDAADDQRNHRNRTTTAAMPAVNWSI